MVKFIKKVILFFALIAIIDVASGYGFKYLRAHAKGGDTQKSYYISEVSCEDVIILGSSRAARHYDPLVLEDSVGMSCFNCGEPGCGIITAYARYGMIEERKKPKLVIYEVSPKYDYFKSDDYSKYLGRVRQYSYKPSVRALFLEFGDHLEGLRLLSNLYINNGYILDNVLDVICSGNNNRGFEPLLGVLTPQNKQKPPVNEQDLDRLKLSYMEKLIKKTHNDNVTLIFMASPQYCNKEEAEVLATEFGPLMELCKQNNVPFINHTYMEGVSNNCKLFQDYKHLNKTGASIYTKAICSEIKSAYGV